ncbi:FAD synthetase family protein [Salibacterium aidingense]|uniref:FAD synthetase family protein n=1 Tax=Salibacterium aidingense TaxID=384933 RepID=UPI003BB9C692
MRTIHVGYPIEKIIQQNSEPSVMALGFFDGVHLGHQEIIKSAKAIADQKNLQLAVMTFYPHPSTVINKGEQITRYLTPLPVKEKMFKKLGVDLLYVVKFERKTAKVSHKDFVDDYLYGLHCRHAVAGFDYTYGFKGEGNMAQLNLDAEGRFGVTTVEKMEKHSHKVSSTLLRELISSGQVEHVPSYLGGRYEMQGVLRQENHQYRMYIDADYFLPSPGTYEVTLKNGPVVTKGMCEVSSSDRPGALTISTFYDLPFEDHAPIQLLWENFIADYDMNTFHAQLPLDEMELSISE